MKKSIRKLGIVLVLILLSITLVSCKCKHKDKDNNGLCDKCGIELEHRYVDGICINCGGVDPNYVAPLSLSGEYILESAIFDSHDVSSEFILYKVIFKENYQMIVQISHNGFLEMRSSTYTFNGTLLKETYGSNTYQYTFINSKLYTTYDDVGDLVEITLKFKEDEILNTKVNFESVLFGESLLETKKYNYCPAIIQEIEDGHNIMHIWYCMNRDSGVIMDYIGYRKGVQDEDGLWEFSDEEIAIAPTPNTWDARHTCDPTVIKGIFNYHGTTYYYLMAYLGCTTEDYQKNETGIAVSVTPNGPWVKIDEVNPIVPWYDDGNIETEEAKYQSYKGTNRIYWGTGMPSLVSIDSESKVLLFYQSTLRGTGIKEIDLSVVETPVVNYTVSLQSTNIYNSVNQKCNISIPDFGYDPATKRFYVASVTNERNPADVTLTRVNSHSFVAYLENINSMEELSTLLKNGGYRWKILGYVGPNETGWERNHNPGLVKNSYGYIPDSSNIGIVVSTGHNSWPNENIFTYRLYGHIFQIE